MSISSESEAVQPNAEKPEYKITLYLDTPKMFLRPGQDTVYGGKLHGGITDTTWYTGHAFIGLSDGKSEEKWGFGPDHSVVDSMALYMTGCKSEFKREDSTHYNEAIVYPVGEKQFRAAQRKIEEYKAHPELEYKLFSRNCSTVASSVLKAAGVKAPPGKLVGLKAKLKLQKMFGVKTPAPKAAMLAVLRSKPLPVPVELGSEMGRQGGKINEKRVMDFLLPLKTQRV